jgi:DNA-binding IclR family transcriptional regulator
MDFPDINDPPEDARKGIQSVEQAARVLNALIAHRRALPLKTIAAGAGMSASMAHRYLASLIRVDLVRQEPGTGLYDFGPMAARLGLAAIDRFDHVERADENLRTLTSDLHIDGHISIWGDFGPTIVRIRQANSPILTNLRLGRTLPLLGSASGRVFLAHLPGELTQALLDAELRRMPDLLEARRELDESNRHVRAHGYAWIDGTVVPGLRAIAAPILDVQGTMRGCMALVSPAESLIRFPNTAQQSLLAAAQRTSRELGYRGA